MKDYFKYNNGEGVVPEGVFRISPSGLSRFFDATTAWYRENLLGEEGFTGSTATALGNCVHVGAEMYVDTKEVDHSQILAYIDSLDENYDKEFIKEQYPVMLDTLINNYLMNNMPSETELFLAKELSKEVWVGGSIDSIIGDIIVDYKTTSSKNPPNTVSRPYWFQQCTYVWLARQHGYNINSFRLVYITTNDTGRVSEKTGKALKDYPSKICTIDYYITDQDMEIIENTLKLIDESVRTWNHKPELRHLLAQDMRLAPMKKHRLFLNKQTEND